MKELNHEDTMFLIDQYHVISNNRLQHNELLWNFQLVFLTAQAFLLIIALGGFIDNPLSRAIGAFCGFVFGFMSIQAFERNRIMEVADAELLLDIENHINKRKIHPRLSVHNKPQTYNYLNGRSILQELESRGRLNFLNRGSSYELWKCGMWLVMLIEFSLFLYHLFVFGFKGYEGAFLWCNSYNDFRESINKLVLSGLLFLLSVNWVFYMLQLVLKSQPCKEKNGKGRQKSYVGEDAEKSLRYFRIIIYALQTCLILYALLNGILAWIYSIDYNPNMWMVILYICFVLTPIPFIYTKSQKGSVHKQKH